MSQDDPSDRTAVASMTNDEIRALAVDQLDLSYRTMMALLKARAFIVDDILRVPQEQWLRAFSIGSKSLGEIVEALASLDPSLIRRDVTYDRTPLPRERRSTLKCLYFIRCGLFVKIGVASDAAARRDDLQAGNPEPLELLHAIACEGHDGQVLLFESSLHRQFREFHHRGEWFRYEGELRDYVEALRAGRT